MEKLLELKYAIRVVELIDGVVYIIDNKNHKIYYNKDYVNKDVQDIVLIKL